ncbi:hypothetical protein [Pontibacter sp. G13]|uniref:hypothetical protein n=1 Tax=Pontibacter sp. G13 TaxID=3074898 RepID=UPI002889B842|nr:hypothetical protein [Pontibacter sp. G13]WNJ17890.1 hypothetical protein RJD25_23805 [Pontibacter sp. G13]
MDFIGLEMIIFHDLPLKKMTIQLESAPKLIIEISEYDDTLNEYIEKEITFEELETITPEKVPFDHYHETEIYSFDYFLTGTLFHGKMVCLEGPGKPHHEIEFSCKSVTIKE